MVIVAGIGKTLFHQLLPPPAAAGSRGAVGLRAGYMERPLVFVPLEGAPKFTLVHCGRSAQTTQTRAGALYSIVLRTEWSRRASFRSTLRDTTLGVSRIFQFSL